MPSNRAIDSDASSAPVGAREPLRMPARRPPSRRRRRNTVPKGNTAKFSSYVTAFGWIKRSVANRFFLEAITLEESIICDRLISYLCRVGALKPDQSLEKRSLASLISVWGKTVSNPIRDPFFADLQSDTDNWRKQRNLVVHGIVKSVPGAVHRDISDFKKVAEAVAIEGERIAKSVCNWSTREKRKLKQARR